MAIKDSFRRALTINRKSSSSSSSPASPTSSGFTSPALSPTASSTQLPDLSQTTTTQTVSDKSLRLTKSSSSGLSKLSRFRSNKSEFERHAPKNFKFATADPEKIAVINEWEWNYGASRRSVSSGVCPLMP